MPSAAVRPLLVAGLLLVAARPASADELDEARAALDAHPADVDLRLRLALVLSWKGLRDESRQEAERVIQQAPEYWDAHLLLARLDGWDGKYAKSRERLQRVLKHHRTTPALLQLVDLELWDERPAEAQKLLDGPLGYEKSAQTYWLRARVAELQLRYWRAYQLAAQALRLDPVHRLARDLRQKTVLVSTDLAYLQETVVGEQTQYSHSEILTVSVLPRAWLYVTLMHEFHYRFETLNNRLQLQGDWRITKHVQLSLAGAVGYPAEVIPDATVATHISFPILSRWDAGVGYTFDHLVYPAQLHRLRFDNGIRLARDFRLEVAYIVGVFYYAGDDRADWNVDDLHGVHARLYWNPGWIEIYGQYAYGMELYYPTPWAKWYFDPSQLNMHTIGFQIMGNVSRRWTLRGGYDIELRHNGTHSHLLHFAVRLSV